MAKGKNGHWVYCDKDITDPRELYEEFALDCELGWYLSGCAKYHSELHKSYMDLEDMFNKIMASENADEIKALILDELWYVAVEKNLPPYRGCPFMDARWVKDE